MAVFDFNPFDRFRFNNSTCFLTGEGLDSSNFKSVFPNWILDRYGLSGQQFKMLDEGHMVYDAVKVPCSDMVYEAWVRLDNEIKSAADEGYSAMKSIDQVSLFQWVGLWVYGVIYNEIQVGIRQQLLSGEALNFSQVLSRKFANFHLMLKSLIIPTEFESINPFSVRIFHIDNPPDHFSYRDEINTMVFSMRMNDFGIIACLQDNGTNFKYHEDVLEFAAEEHLHPLQFEEVCARVFYSCYLFNRLPDYTVSPTYDKLYIEPMSLMSIDRSPIFDTWQNKTYAQVLENFWKPWGYTLFEIMKDPEYPMSFLENPAGEFISKDSIPLSNSGI